MTIRYPELNQILNTSAELIAENLHNKVKITCLNSISLSESRSIKFEYVNKNGNNVYYVTNSAFSKFKKQFNVTFDVYFD